MKKICSAILLVAAFTLPALAQDTLTGPRINPNSNEAFTSINCDTSASTLVLSMIAPASGPAHTWDFSGLTSISTDTAKEDTCNSTPYCSLFIAGTNKAAQTLSSNTYVYNIINADSVATTGYYESTTQYSYLTNPMVTMKYPFTYLDSFNDAYAGTVAYNPGTGTITANTTGTIHVVCDGWGTLKLPGGVTDANVLRVHGSQVYADSATIFSTAVGATFLINTFQWYMRNYHSPLLNIMFFDQQTGPGSLHFKVVDYAMVYHLGVDNITNIESTLQLFPNPATNELNIKFEANTNERVNISMLDLLGRVVATIPNSGHQGVQEITMNTSSFPRGIYFIRIQSGTETVTRKVSLQ